MPTRVTTKTKSMPGKYIRRAAELFGGSVSSYISEAMPVVSSTAHDVKSAGAELGSYLSNTYQNILPNLRQLRLQAGFRSISSWFMGQAAVYDEEDYNGGFDTNIDIDSSDSSAAEIAESQITEFNKGANQISKTVIETAGKLAESQILSTANIIKSVNATTAAVTAGFNRNNQLLEEILEVVTKNTAALVETNAVIASSNNDDPNKMFGSGKFDFSSYRKMVAKNIENSDFGIAFGIVSSLLENPDDLKQILSPENLAKEGLSLLVNKTSPNLKKNLKALDEVVSDTIMGSLIRLGQQAGSSGLKGLFGELFGIRTERESTDVSRGDLSVKPVAFDTLARESMISVIPGYLRQLVLLNGGPDMVYDYRSRTFRTKAAILKQFNERTATSGNLRNSSEELKKSIKDNQFNQMMHDLMVNYLGANQHNGKYVKDTIESMAEDEEEAISLALGLLGSGYGNDAMRAARKYGQQLHKALSRSSTAQKSFVKDIASATYRRNEAADKFADHARLYEVDISDADTSEYADAEAIRQRYGLRRRGGDDRWNQATYRTGTNVNAMESGVNYTNKALYEIYRRLDTGINVYKVGENEKPEREKFSLFNALTPPSAYRPPNIRTSTAQGKEVIAAALAEDDDENPLQDEDLQTGERVGNWAGKRGKGLLKAIISGNPEDVKSAFGAMIGDIGGVASDAIGNGLGKANDFFGNITGKLSHKVFGDSYDYVDEHGEEVHVKENKGVVGFIGDEFHRMFDKAKEAAGGWIKRTASFFDYGDSEDDGAAVANVKKKILGGSLGAFAGAGILGGPIGLLVGSIAGSAVTGAGLGGKLKDLLFGHDDEGPNATGEATGLISKTVEAVTMPIKYQTEKTLAVVGAAAQKHIFGPMADIGIALKDRLMNHVDSIFQPIKDGIKKVIGGALKKIGGAIGTGIAKLATWSTRAGTTVAGKLTRGVVRTVLAPVGAIQKAAAWVTGSNSYHKLKKGEVYPLFVGQKYYDPNTVNKNDPEDAKKRSHVFVLKEDYDDTNDTSLAFHHKVETLHAYKDIFGRPRKGVMLDGSNPDEWRPATRDYLKWKAEDRNEHIDFDLHRKGFKGGIGGFFAGYRRWLGGKQQEGIDRRKRLKDATSDVMLTPEEYEAEQAKNREIQERQLEAEQNTAEATVNMNRLASEEGSLYTHDKGIHDRLDTIIKAITGGDNNSSGSENNAGAEIGGAEVAPELAGTVFEDDSIGDATIAGAPETSLERERRKKKEKAENEENVTNALIPATATIAAVSGVDDKESKSTTALLDEAAKPESSFDKMRKHFEDIMDGAEDKEKEKKEKEDNFLTSLIGGLGSVVGSLVSGIGSLIGPYLPYILMALIGLNSNLREWILDKLPSILKGAWKFFTDTGENLMDFANDTYTVHDDVDNTDKNMITSEDLHNNYAQGLWKSSFMDASNPLLLGYDALGSSLFGKGMGLVASIAGGGSAIGSGALKFINTAKNGFINRFMPGSSAQLANYAAQQTGSGGAAAALGTGAQVFSGIAKGFANPLSMVAGMAGSLASRTVTNFMESNRHQDMLGDYGLGVDAGSARFNDNGVGNGMAIASNFAATSAFAIAYGLAAAGLVNGWNPVGWGLAIAAAVVLVMAALTALVNAAAYYIKEKKDENFAIRTNSSKLNKIINGYSYTYDSAAPVYVYCPYDSDRVCGLDQGIFKKNPEVMFGQMLKTIRLGLSSAPGSEVLLYDLLKNMTIQGVPFAVYATGYDSRECDVKGRHANEDLGCTPITTSEAKIYRGAKTKVLNSTVVRKKTEILKDINIHIARFDSDATFTWEDVETLYKAGDDVFKALVGKGILNSSGTVQTKKFKNAPGSTSGAEGWKGLEELGRTKGIYFLQQCLIYINSKVDVDKQGRQWLVVNESYIEEIGKNLADVAKAEGEAAIKSLKDAGYTDDEIKEFADSAGKQSPGAADITPAPTFSAESKEATKMLTNSQLENLTNYYRYVAASYMYSHPDSLKEWASQHPDELIKLGLDVGEADEIGKYNSQSKEMKSALQGEMAILAKRYADLMSDSDIYDMIPKFNWEDVKSYAESNPTPEQTWTKQKKGEAMLFITEPEKSDLGKLWEDGQVARKTPTEMHKALTGNKEHGKGAEVSSKSSFYYLSQVGNYGALGHLADVSTLFATDDWRDTVKGIGARHMWEGAIVASGFNSPSRLSYNVPDPNASTGKNDEPTTPKYTKPANYGSPSSQKYYRNKMDDIMAKRDNFEYFSIGGPTPEDEARINSQIYRGIGGPADWDDLLKASGLSYDDIIRDKHVKISLPSDGDTPTTGSASGNYGYNGTGTTTTGASIQGGNPLGTSSSISSEYGWRDLDNDGKVDNYHQGIDLVPRSGSDNEVRARFSGTVKVVNNSEQDRAGGTPLGKGFNNSAGNYVIYQADNGLIIKNYHLKQNSIPSDILNGVGTKRVTPGMRLGTMGNTGNSSGSHLHYQIDDPSNLFPSLHPGDSKAGDSIDPRPSYNSTGGDFLDYSSNDGMDSSGDTNAFAIMISKLQTIGNEALSMLTDGLLGRSGSFQLANINGGGNTYSSYNPDVSSFAMYLDYTGNIKNYSDFISLCQRELGTSEDSNGKVKYATWFYNGTTYNRCNWDLMFVEWCFNEAELSLDIKTNSISTFLEHYEQKHPEMVKTNQTPKPGDIVIYESNGSMVRCGIIKSASSSNSFVAIEGNVTSKGRTVTSVTQVTRNNSNLDQAGLIVAAFIRAVDFEALADAVKYNNSKIPNITSADVPALWAYFKTLGYTDAAIAGILGCWQAESGITAKKVEWSSGFQKYVGDHDRVATDRIAMDDFTQHLFDQYDSQGLKINRGAYYGKDGHLYPGLGLAQWTGERGEALLKFAKENNTKWYDHGTQLGFFNYEMSTYKKDAFEDLQKQLSPELAAKSFCINYEGFTGDRGARDSTARKFYDQYAGKISAYGGPKPFDEPDTSAIMYSSLNENGMGGPTPEDEMAINALTQYRDVRRVPSRIGSGEIKGPSTSKPLKKPSKPVVSKATVHYPKSKPQPYGLGDPGTGQYNFINAGTDVTDILGVLNRVAGYLEVIQRNTGESNGLLDELNAKEFGITGGTTTYMGTSKKGSSSTPVGAIRSTSANNTRLVSRMVRP